MIRRRRVSNLNRKTRCVCITVFRLLFYALQIMTRSGLGHSLWVPYCIETNSPWLLSPPPAALPTRNIHAGTRCFRPKLFCRTRPVTTISSGAPHVWGGRGEPVQTTSGIARNLEMSRAPPARGVNREINTARATGDTQCATNNRRVTRHSRHTWLIGPQQLELLFNLRWHSTRPRRNAVLSNETIQKCSQKNINF